MRGDLGAPACNTCHGNHAASPPGVAQVSRSCSLCHSANASLFDGSKHKQAFDQHNWPECGQCHSNHAIAKTHDSMLATGPGQLCGDCHREYAKDNPECIKTADYFHDTITQLDQARNKIHRGLGKVRSQRPRCGADQQPTDRTYGRVKEVAHICAFVQPKYFSAGGCARAKKPSNAPTHWSRKPREEFKYRQIGLIVSIAFIGLLMLAFI